MNDITGIGQKTTIVGLLTLGILIIGFVPVPLEYVSADYSFEMEAMDDTNATIAPNGTRLFSVEVNNTGNVLNHIEFTKTSSPNYWTVVFKRSDQNESSYREVYDIALNSTEIAVVHVMITAAETAQVGSNATVVVKASARNSTFHQELTFNMTVVDSLGTFSLSNGENSFLPQHAEMARERTVDPQMMSFDQLEFFRAFEQ